MSTKFWPGLGESETLYAWVIMAGGIGEIGFLPVVGYMAANLPYSVSLLVAALLLAAGGAICVSLLVAALLLAAGGAIYAVASAGWIVILGKVVIGGAGSFLVLVHTYIGEMGTIMDRMRSKKRKRPMKFVLYIALSFILNGGYLVTFCELFR